MTNDQMKELIQEAELALKFISDLLSKENPAEAIDLLTNFGDDVEDRLIAAIAKAKTAQSH